MAIDSHEPAEQATRPLLQGFLVLIERGLVHNAFGVATVGMMMMMMMVVVVVVMMMGMMVMMRRRMMMMMMMLMRRMRMMMIRTHERDGYL